jgi:hypothetical protein
MSTNTAASSNTRVITDQHEPPGRITPLKAIRSRCIDCRGYEKSAVRKCDFTDCPLHRLRMGRGSRSTLRPIRVYCIWCMSGQREEVRQCPSVKCSLWPYRFGRRPQKPFALLRNGSTAGVLDQGTEGGARLSTRPEDRADLTLANRKTVAVGSPGTALENANPRTE